MTRVLFGLLAGAALIAATPPAPGRGDPDTGIDPPIGAAARARHGIDPLARPADDVGMADDPADGNAPGSPPVLAHGQPTAAEVPAHRP